MAAVFYLAIMPPILTVLAVAAWFTDHFNFF
jgi:hypothetical protein